jgi:hypothetical protein
MPAADLSRIAERYRAFAVSGKSASKDGPSADRDLA